MNAPTITGVRAVVTAPEGVNLVVVRIDTSEPGLYGLGCATFHQRYAAVVAALDTHVTPLLLGRDVSRIADIHRTLHFSSYWRGGPVLNSALSGVDMALWDIAGKRAGLPVHDLVGGRLRDAVPVYLHASGATIDETLDDAQALVEAGYRHVRLQTGQPGLGTYGAPGTSNAHPGAPYPDGWDVGFYLRQTPRLFAAARARLGDDVELLHDVHSRLTPKQAVTLARSLEPYGLFFLEDVIAPEHYDELPAVRAQAPVPLAVGELTVSVADAARLVTAGGVDLLRCHISAIGGFTPGLKLATLCEMHGVRTAWHAPADVSPIGAAANLALDVTSPAFGIQEGHIYPDVVHEILPGTPVIEAGYAHPSLSPGWGIDLNEKAAARYEPVVGGHERWAATVRRPDGSIEAP
ncbi:starvation-sensing protein RspA [Actinoplanes sp. LDG1-06]|uniref:Starvation-sensing protein RspA n=1 Tax=Paractinoplanes ovalisporus TaxID=2810368 RepID=A0ABS2ARA3_9ACTN|nr:enolase C-terminal domain-like protein [Actinoplanes ovalisporus]MBM2622397.1 starvation-sensing protein RspA [Actinoplanes ovalisporus]